MTSIPPRIASLNAGSHETSDDGENTAACLLEASGVDIAIA
ncbi:MAG: hypothetical protein RID53_01615 [Coleofasciculus sp. B1-GNL1-01]